MGVTFRREGQAAIVELNNPPVNAIGRDIRQGLRDVLDRLPDEAGLTRVILTVVFVALVVPIGLLLRLLGKDLLDEQLDREAPSYWRPKSYRDPSPARLEKYY